MLPLLGAAAPGTRASAQPASVAPAVVDSSLASSVTWKDQMGLVGNRANVMYSVMMNGFFRRPTFDMDAQVHHWLGAHPLARMVTVATMQPMMTQYTQSQIRLVWVVDGPDTLNLDLVRAGACQGGTMLIPPGLDQRISPSAYQASLRSLVRADSLAEQARLGVWADSATRAYGRPLWQLSP
jgi:hypothetical protein